MGNQQLLLLTLTTIIVGIAIAVGISMVKDYDFDSIGDEVHQHLMSIGSDVYAYSMKPAALGGGSGKVRGYVLQDQMKETPNATYSIGQTKTTGIGIIAASKRPEYAGKLILLLGNDPTPLDKNSEMKISFFGTAKFRKYNMSERPFVQ